MGAVKVHSHSLLVVRALPKEQFVAEIKRLMGRRFNETGLQADVARWPFAVVEENGKPRVSVTHRGAACRFWPEELSAMVLGKMRAAAEARLSAGVRRAVITVPAYFTDAQRSATRDAGAIAGLQVLRIVNEPTAAALAFGLGADAAAGAEERRVLIFDLGGGTLDVSVLSIEEGIFEVLATAGDTHLGGEDLDLLLAERLAAEWETAAGAPAGTLRAHRPTVRRLRSASERAKRTLSSAGEATVDLAQAVVNGVSYPDLRVTLTRAQFEEICGPLLRGVLPPLREALREAKLQPREVDEIVLVGGSTRIPLVRALVQAEFPGQQLNTEVHPDEAVAVGAAVQAAILAGDLGDADAIADMVLVDVTPLSLGLEAENDFMATIIERNTPIPHKYTQPFLSAYNNQTVFDLRLYEGERRTASANRLLGSFRVDGVAPLPAEQAIIDVTFEIDADGILQASAVESTRGKSNKITVRADRSRLTQAEIETLIKEAERMNNEDMRLQEAAKARRDLEVFCSNMKSKVERNASISTSDKQTVATECDATLRWLRDNPNASKQDCDVRRRELELVLQFMVSS